MASERESLVGASKIHPIALENRLVVSNKRCEIVFRDLSYSVKLPGEKKGHGPFAKKTLNEKPILQNISGVFKPGRLCAIMGASGAGKTSLLQVLAGEIHQGEIFGEILINGNKSTAKTIKDISGFVFQDDLILGTMTVREAITMSALLRLKNLSLEERVKKVNEIISILDLDDCADTIIGNENVKGISGGQRKRTAIAMELVTNPFVLFLDEPTSGLDTFTAFSVIYTLKALAAKGATIIATIHQPSSDIFHIFDDLLLLASGRMMYQGPSKDAVDYFSKLGYPCPNFTNPADHFFMKILNNEITSSDQQAKKTNQNRIEQLLLKFENSPENQKIIDYVSRPPVNLINSASFKQKSPFFSQYSYLFGRASKNAFRNPLIVKAKAGQVLVIALIIGLLYLHMNERTGPSATQDRMGVLFFLSVNNVFSSSIGMLSIFGLEKLVFSREHGAGYYSLPAYFLSKVMVEVPFQIILPWLGGTVIYWMAGLQNDVAKYFIAMAIIVSCSVCGFALGICFASIFTSLPVALMVTPLVLMPLMLFSGLFANEATMPAYFSWIRFISPIKYGFEGLARNEFGGLMLNVTGNATIPLTKGEVILENLGFKDDLNILYDCLILLLMVFVFMFIAYLGLLRIVSQNSKSVPIKNPSSKKSKELENVKVE